MPNFIVSNLNFDAIDSKFQFTMNGPIMVQARPKITYHGRNKPVYYDPSHNDKILWKTALITAISSQQRSICIPIFPIDKYNNKGFELHLQFFEKRPKLDFDKHGVLKDKHHMFPYQRDVDNMVKFIMDSMNGVLYNDDSSVVKIVSEKIYLSDKTLATHVADNEKVVVAIYTK